MPNSASEKLAPKRKCRSHVCSDQNQTQKMKEIVEAKKKTKEVEEWLSQVIPSQAPPEPIEMLLSDSELQSYADSDSETEIMAKRGFLSTGTNVSVFNTDDYLAAALERMKTFLETQRESQERAIELWRVYEQREQLNNELIAILRKWVQRKASA